MLRLLVSPKWITWHVLTLGAMVACGFLSAWQWHRAGSAMGSGLNIGYGVQWPIFAVFFGVMWWRFLRMEIRDLRAAGTGPALADAGVVEAPRRDEAPAADPSPGERSPTEDVDRPGRPVDDRTAPSGGPPHDRPSPFGPRPAGVEPSRLSDPQIRAYNQALAELAARDREN